MFDTSEKVTSIFVASYELIDLSFIQYYVGLIPFDFDLLFGKRRKIREGIQTKEWWYFFLPLQKFDSNYLLFKLVTLVTTLLGEGVHAKFKFIKFIVTKGLCPNSDSI